MRKGLSARLLTFLGHSLLPAVVAQGSCGVARPMSMAVNNFQLGSKIAGPGQQQLRIEADYATCTQ